MTWKVKGEVGGEELTLGTDLPFHDALAFHQVLTEHVDTAYRSAIIRPHMSKISYWVEGECESALITIPREPLPKLILEAALI